MKTALIDYIIMCFKHEEGNFELQVRRAEQVFFLSCSQGRYYGRGFGPLEKKKKQGPILFLS